MTEELLKAVSAAPHTLLDSTVLGLPGYIITNFFPHLRHSILNHPKIVKIITFLLALKTVGPWAYGSVQPIKDQIWSFWSTTVFIDPDDDLFYNFLDWLSRQKLRSFQDSFWAATNTSGELWGALKAGNELDEKCGIEFKSTQGTYVFSFQRRIFFVWPLFSHDEKDKDNTKLALACLGWSREPLKKLLKHVNNEYTVQPRETTRIRRPHQNSHGHWDQYVTKPRRMLDTVDLDEQDKQLIVDDVKTYLAQPTKRWYENRGIPYRRGYLFHGPPGAGKTSMALALAHEFKCNVHIVSLLEPNITDSSLIGLFNKLPDHTLVLLEDIDSAGINRELDNQFGYWDDEDDESDQLAFGRRKKKSSDVTLSGLLNAIDGAGAPEGHILIMTSNNPDDLDEALIRPGRIDMRIGFHHASHFQARDMFLRIYTLDEEERCIGLPPLNKEQLDHMASQFMGVVPEHAVSTAELQEYLLFHRKDPAQAIRGAKAWVESVLKQREEAQKRKQEKEKKANERREGRQKSPFSPVLPVTTTPAQPDLGDALAKEMAKLRVELKGWNSCMVM